MPAPISPISVPAIADTIRPPGGARGGGFAEVLSSAIQNVEASGRDATASVERFLAGEGEELHTAILAAQRADLAFEMFQQVRNKVVSAYQEIMRMPM